MAFRKKSEFLQKYNPDIVIVPECENIEKLIFNKDLKVPNDIIWYGNNQNKGLGVFSYSDYRFKLLECHNPEYKNILPIIVSGGKFEFLLFAIWANNPADKDGAYITQVWKALNYYENLLSNEKIILIGDFNSNTIWDKPRRQGNHSTVVQKLEGKNIFSTYHHYFKQIQGKEIHPTLFMYRHKEKPYHIDYCFASNYFIDNLKSVEVGVYEDWTKHSDHKPLIVDFLI